MDQPIPTSTPTAEDGIRTVLASLPVLSKDDVPLDDSCPICLIPFQSVLDEKAGEAGCESVDAGCDSGVTKLVGCGHIFCRKEWVIF
jgi:hypothetical protein